MVSGSDTVRLQLLLKKGACLWHTAPRIITTTALAVVYILAKPPGKLPPGKPEKKQALHTSQTGRLVFTNESLFYENGKQCHVIEFYYLMKPKGRKLIKNGSIMDAAQETSSTIKERLQWLPLEKFAEYKAFPEFFGEKLIHIPETIEHLVSDERQQV